MLFRQQIYLVLVSESNPGSSRLYPTIKSVHKTSHPYGVLDTINYTHPIKLLLR